MLEHTLCRIVQSDEPALKKKKKKVGGGITPKTSVSCNRSHSLWLPCMLGPKSLLCYITVLSGKCSHGQVVRHTDTTRNEVAEGANWNTFFRWRGKKMAHRQESKMKENEKETYTK